MSDFDLMMQRRKEAMSRARKRRSKVSREREGGQKSPFCELLLDLICTFLKDIYLTSADEQVVALIREMKLAAEVRSVTPLSPSHSVLIIYLLFH